MTKAVSNPLLVPPPHQGPPIPYQQLLEEARETLPSFLPTKAKEVMLALDVDGTLLQPEGASQNVRRAVSDALDAGINIVIATGRGRPSTRPVFESLNLPDGFSVSSNGAQTFEWHRPEGGEHQSRLLREVRFQPEEAARIVLDALPNALIGVDDGVDGLLVSEYFPKGELLSKERVVPIDELLKFSTPRLVVRAPWMERDHFADIMDGLPLENVEYSVGWTAWVDISPAGVTKASGLEQLVGDLGVPKQGTIAIGDGTNDIEMLQWAAHGVAMGGATEQVKAAADAVAGPVDYDGAAAVIEALVERY